MFGNWIKAVSSVASIVSEVERPASMKIEDAAVSDLRLSKSTASAECVYSRTLHALSPDKLRSGTRVRRTKKMNEGIFLNANVSVQNPFQGRSFPVHFFSQVNYRLDPGSLQR